MWSNFQVYQDIFDIIIINEYQGGLGKYSVIPTK